MKKIQEFLGWCLVLNSVMLFVTTMIVIMAHDDLYPLYNHFYKVSTETFNMVILGYLGFWKALVIVFVAIPYVALRIVDDKKDETTD